MVKLSGSALFLIVVSGVIFGSLVTGLIVQHRMAKSKCHEERYKLIEKCLETPGCSMRNMDFD